MPRTKPTSPAFKSIFWAVQFNTKWGEWIKRIHWIQLYGLAQMTILSLLSIQVKHDNNFKIKIQSNHIKWNKYFVQWDAINLKSNLRIEKSGLNFNYIMLCISNEAQI